jgi:hypothetical protein
MNTDPVPDPDPGFWWPEIDKNLQVKIFITILWSKIALYLFLGIHKGRPTTEEAYIPQKNIQHFKTWKF